MAETKPLRPWALRQRLQRWFESRVPPNDHLTLTQRNVYILPTRPGLAFVATLLVLLVASINDQLSLGYLLTFLLAGCGLASMHSTHAMLRGLSLHLRPVPPTHAGSPASLVVRLHNPSGDRYGLGLRLAGTTHGPDTVWLDAAAQSQTSAHLSFVPSQRGLHPLPLLRIETRFPLGLFGAWAVWRPAGEVLVYPQAETAPPPLPEASAVPHPSGLARSLGGGNEYEGVRAYQRGDALKTVVWKKAAQALQGGGELVVRDSSAQVTQQLWLDHAQCVGLAPEARLSRLCAWVSQAQAAGLDHGLRLPGLEIAPAQGAAHQAECLRALALYEQGSAS